jgi:hypothetical protein
MSLTISDFLPGRIFTFKTLCPTILGETVSQAKLVQMCDFNTARTISNVEAMSATVFPYLPTGTPADFRNYTYLVFEVNTKKLCLALPWIDLTNAAIVTVTSATINVTNADSVALNKIASFMVALGLNFTIS